MNLEDLEQEIRRIAHEENKQKWQEIRDVKKIEDEIERRELNDQLERNREFVRKFRLWSSFRSSLLEGVIIMCSLKVN